MSGESGSGKGRAALVAVGVLALVTVPLALWGASSGSGGGGDELVVDVQRAGAGAPVEVVVSFRDAQTLGGAAPRGQLRVDCRDPGGQTVVSSPVAYPLDTDRGTLPPHTHVTATEQQAERIARCSIEGFERSYEGRVR